MSLYQKHVQFCPGIDQLVYSFLRMNDLQSLASASPSERLFFYIQKKNTELNGQLFNIARLLFYPCILLHRANGHCQIVTDVRIYSATRSRPPVTYEMLAWGHD